MTSSAPYPSLTNHQIGEISHALRLALTGLPAGVKATFRLRTQRRRLLQAAQKKTTVQDYISDLLRADIGPSYSRCERLTSTADALIAIQEATAK